MPGLFGIGRIKGIPVRLHWTLAFIAALLGLTLGAEILPRAAPGHSSLTYWIAAAVGCFVFFASVLAHELAHAMTALHFGVETESIELWLFGGMARLRSESPTPKADAAIAVAGPLSNILIGAAMLGAAFGLHSLDVPLWIPAVLEWLAVMNGVIGVFNLLPGAPLDGGRLLRAYRWRRTGDRLHATQDAARAGQILGWMIIIVGAWLMFNGWGGIFLPFTGWLLVTAAKAEERAAITEVGLGGMTVQDVVLYGIAHAPADTDTETMLFQRSRLGLPKMVAVESGDGSITGLVAEEQLWRVPEGKRAAVRLAQLAIPIQRVVQAQPDEPLAHAIRRLHPLAPVITVWRDGQLEGVVTPEALAKQLKVTLPATRE